MATESTFVYDESFQAAADLSSLQFYIVKSTGLGLVSLCTGSSFGSAGPVGILQNTPSSNQAATVRLLGKSKVVAGAAIGIGTFVTATTAGTATAGTTAATLCIGRACSASTAAGQLIEVLMLGQAGFGG